MTVDQAAAYARWTSLSKERQETRERAIEHLQKRDEEAQRYAVAWRQEMKQLWRNVGRIIRSLVVERNLRATGEHLVALARGVGWRRLTIGCVIAVVAVHLGGWWFTVIGFGTIAAAVVAVVLTVKVPQK
jgi:hypothetical protein